MMNKIIILNGPNLNLLGEEKNQYGILTLKEIEKKCNEYGKNNNLSVTFFNLTWRENWLKKSRLLEMITTV